MQHARTRFNYLLGQFQEALDDRLACVACKQAHNELSQKLTGALVDGKTVCFEDEGALGAYALKRLRARSRAVFEVLLAEDSGEILHCLLRRCAAATQECRQLRIASLGGGPAFDVVGLLATLESLAEAMSEEPAVNSEGFNRCDDLLCSIRCTVLDLAPAWGSAVAAVAEVSSKIWPRQETEFVELIAPVDLRSSDCWEIIDTVCRADIVIASYVLHENEAAILSQNRLQGAFPQIFQHLPVGTPMIFLDATHRLWPVLVETAEAVIPQEENLKAVIPDGMGSHIHAALLLKSTLPMLPGPTKCIRSAMEIFAAHQRANQVRLQKLQPKSANPGFDEDDGL